MSLEAMKLKVLAKLEEEKDDAMRHYENAVNKGNVNTAAQYWTRVVMKHQAVNAFRHVHGMKQKERI